MNKMRSRRKTIPSLTKTIIGQKCNAIASIIRGHCNYYGVNGNFHAIQSSWKYLKYFSYRILNRRHQKRSMKYDKFLRNINE